LISYSISSTILETKAEWRPFAKWKWYASNKIGGRIRFLKYIAIGIAQVVTGDDRSQVQKSGKIWLPGMSLFSWQQFQRIILNSTQWNNIVEFRRINTKYALISSSASFVGLMAYKSPERYMFIWSVELRLWLTSVFKLLPFCTKGEARQCWTNRGKSNLFVCIFFYPL